MANLDGLFSALGSPFPALGSPLARAGMAGGFDGALAGAFGGDAFGTMAGFPGGGFDGFSAPGGLAGLTGLGRGRMEDLSGLGSLEMVFNRLFDGIRQFGRNRKRLRRTNVLDDRQFADARVGTNARVARVEGDPHVFGLDGGRFDFMGEADKYYNMLSDSNVQYNAKFKGIGPGATALGEVGFQVGTAQSGYTRIQFAPGGRPIVNGQVLRPGTRIVFDTGLVNNSGQRVRGFVAYNEQTKTMSVNTGEYQFDIIDQGGQTLDQRTQVTTLGVKSDGVTAHGVFGQTAHFQPGRVLNGRLGQGAQGEGAIAGHYRQYEVSGLFATQNTYSRFGRFDATQRRFGVGSGQTGQSN